MKKGFTILELLVASLLLGMLVTVLTMIFNQSSIAWRTGTAGVADLGSVCDNMAEIREEADNAFVWGSEVYRHTGLWDKDGKLRDRACDAQGSSVASEDGGKWRANILRGGPASQLTKKTDRTLWSSGQNMLSVGQSGTLNSYKNYTVNVKSNGPDREPKTWDDIWSWPDEFE